MFDCEECSSSFPTKWKLDRHREKHTIFGATICMLCNTYISRIDGLVDHWRKTCQGMICVLSYEEREHLSTHGIKEAVYSYIIDSYSPNLKSVNDMNLVPADHASFGHFCVYCNLLLKSSSLKRHHAIHTGLYLPGVPLEDNTYACDLCGLTFRMKHFLQKHWRESCTEILAHIPPEGLVMRNSELATFVADLVHRASLINESTYSLDGSRRDGEQFDHGASGSGENMKEVVHAEHADDFATRILPPFHISRSKWTRKNSTCVKCGRAFINAGRLERHCFLFHMAERMKEQCPLCAAGISRRSALNDHFRKSCVAMKSEVPNPKIRLTMGDTDLSNLVHRVKYKWQMRFEKQKELNLEDMRAFLRNSDKHNIDILNVQLAQSLPIPSVKPVTDKKLFGLRCPVCNIRFQNEGMTQKHVNVVHPNTSITELRKVPKTGEKEFIRRPVFYDENNKQIKAGKLLSKDVLLTKQLNEGTVRPNVRLKLRADIINRTCMIVEVIGKTSKQMIILEEHEISLVLNEHGKLKTLYAFPRKLHEDIPVLDREDYHQTG